jgi:hypothetical protein
MQVVGDQPDLRPRDTTVALMNMPDDGAFQIIISSRRQMFHHMRSMDSQRLISTLTQSGLHHHVDIASRDTSLRIQAKMNLLLPAQREDPKRVLRLQLLVDTHLQTTDHRLLPVTRHRSVLIALMRELTNLLDDDQRIAPVLEKSYLRRSRISFPTDSVTPKIATETRLELHHTTPIPHAGVEAGIDYPHLVSAKATPTSQEPHLKQIPATMKRTEQGECARSETESETANANVNAEVDRGNSTGNERRSDVNGIFADQRWNDGLAATQMPSDAVTIPDGTRDPIGRGGISACRPMSGGQVPLGPRTDDMLSRRINELAYRFSFMICTFASCY